MTTVGGNFYDLVVQWLTAARANGFFIFVCRLTLLLCLSVFPCPPLRNSFAAVHQDKR